MLWRWKRPMSPPMGFRSLHKVALETESEQREEEGGSEMRAKTT